MGLIANLRKDLMLMKAGKFFWLVLGSIIIYSLYISLVYVNQDVHVPTIYLYDPLNKVEKFDEKIIEVTEVSVLKEKILNNEDAIAMNYQPDIPQIIISESGNDFRNRLNADYAFARIKAGEGNHESLNIYTREEKLKREMVCEVIFFEIVFVGFIGIASLVFKEKHMGVLKVRCILPVKIHSFVFSKIILFLICDLLFCIFLIGINLGVTTIVDILPKVFLHITILSGIMALCGNICALFYKDFKQFGLSYAFIIILLTSPIYLVANTQITWGWINYYFPYQLYMKIKQGFFGEFVFSPLYGLVCILLLIGLYVVEMKLMKRMYGEG